MASKTSEPVYILTDILKKIEYYIKYIKHKDRDLWAGDVDDRLVDLCSAMTAEERLLHYKDSDLKTHQFLIDNNWFPVY